ncbi:hypothetical protein, partial [Streptomyces graminilatus]|uniref:hypothetical protein n=1 Tax=Streptomyces graminilatus TaxID=1464070 RepID=UPI0019D6D538
DVAEVEHVDVAEVEHVDVDVGVDEDVEEDVPELLSVTAGRMRSTEGAGPSDVPLTARSRSALGLDVDPVGRPAGRQTAALALSVQESVREVPGKCADHRGWPEALPATVQCP